MRLFQSLLIFLVLVGSANAQFSQVQLGKSSLNLSPVGMNLNAIATYSGENPLANIMTQASNLYAHLNGSGTGEDALICVDANGNVTDFTHKLTATTGGTCTATPTWNQISTTLNISPISPYYLSGVYDVYYTPGSGVCTSNDCCGMGYSGDWGTVPTSSSPSTGHDTLTVVTPTNTGLELHMTKGGVSSAGAQCVIQSVTRTALTAAYRANCYLGTYDSSCFEPTFTNWLTTSSGINGAKALRFMDWMCTNDNFAGTTITTSNYPTPSVLYYGSNLTQAAGPLCGVPKEIMVALCNTVNADCWFNMPALANDAFVTAFATYVLAHLKSPLNAYIEFSNETWNNFIQFSQLITIIGAGNPSIFEQYAATTAPGGCTENAPGTPCSSGPNGCAASGSGSNSFACNRAVMGYMSNHFCGLWNTAWSNSPRVRCVLGSQAAGTAQASDAYLCDASLARPCTANIQHIAIAPYIGVETPGVWTDATVGSPDGGLTLLFAQIYGTAPLPSSPSNTTTDNGSGTFTLATSGYSVSTTPPNGKCIALTLSANPSASNTLKVDGGNTYPLTDNNGATMQNSGVGSGESINVCFTSSTSAGSVTASWRALFGGALSTNWLAQGMGWLQSYVSTYPTYSIIYYEGGINLVNGGADANAVLTTLYNASGVDSRMGTFYQSNFLPQSKTNGVNGPMLLFNDIGAWGVSGQWGASENVFGSQSGYPKVGGIAAFIGANPCTGYSPTWLANTCH